MVGYEEVAKKGYILIRQTFAPSYGIAEEKVLEEYLSWLHTSVVRNARHTTDNLFIWGK